MDLFDFSLKLPITDPTWIFLLVLLIILFAPILLNRLRIPHIIGMILAGLVIGEHGFNIFGAGHRKRRLEYEAPVNGGRNYNGPKVAKFLVG